MKNTLRPLFDSARISELTRRASRLLDNTELVALYSTVILELSSRSLLPPTEIPIPSLDPILMEEYGSMDTILKSTQQSFSMTSTDGYPIPHSSPVSIPTSVPSRPREEWSPFHPSFASSLPTFLHNNGTTSPNRIWSTEPSNDGWTTYLNTDFPPLK